MSKKSIDGPQAVLPPVKTAPAAGRLLTRAKAIRIALWYAGLGAAWILCSGWVLHHLVHDAALLGALEDIKGWFFVAVTALLLGWGLNRNFRKVRQATQALQESEDRLRLVGDNLPNSLVFQFTRDADGTPRFTYISAGVERVHGLKPEAVLRDANCLFRQIDPAQVPAQTIAETQSARDLTDMGMELQFTRSDGAKRLVHVRARPRRDANGQVRWDGFAEDITERKQAEKALRHSEQNYREIFNAANDAIFLHDATTGRILDVNDAMLRLYGYSSKEEVLSGNIPPQMANEPTYNLEEAVRRIHLAREQGPQVFEWLAYKKNGESFWVEVSLRSSRIDDQDRVLAVVRDITERRRTEEALQLQGAALEAAANAIVITDRSGVIEWVNPAFTKATGYTAVEAIGKNTRFLRSGEYDEAFYRNLWQTILEGKIWHSEIVNRRKDGGLYHEDMTITPVRDGDGKIMHFIAIKQDITERKRLEAQIQQSQKMEAIGQLAGGVAHDFNNILTSMVMQAGLASAHEGLPAAVRDGLQQISADVERAAGLTRQLLLFSRRQAMQSCDLDLNEVVSNLTKMLRRIIGEHIRLQLHLHPLTLMTRADAGMLEQVLVNLAVNARDAMPGGGYLTIETSKKNVDKPHSQLNPDAEPGQYVCVSVSDTGCGIPPEILPRIFEPFFTTKEAGKGTGLGLATVFGIIKQHRGWIEVESQPGNGSTFQVYLPVSATADATDSHEMVRCKPRGGTETILYTEDEATVRASTLANLQRYGYRVLEAGNGVAALELWRQHRESVAMLITDLVMPGGITGQDLAQQLQTDKPDLKVIFISGYSPNIAGKELRLKRGESFVQKPFPPDDLLKLIRSSLDDDLQSPPRFNAPV